MTKQKVWIILGLFSALILLVFSLNFYFLSHLNSNQLGAGGNDPNSLRHVTSKSGYFHLVKKKVRNLKPIYLNKNPKYYSIRNKVWRNFEPKAYDNVTLIWDISYWVGLIYIIYLKFLMSGRFVLITIVFIILIN